MLKIGNMCPADLYLTLDTLNFFVFMRTHLTHFDRLTYTKLAHGPPGRALDSVCACVICVCVCVCVLCVRVCKYKRARGRVEVSQVIAIGRRVDNEPWLRGTDYTRPDARALLYASEMASVYKAFSLFYLTPRICA